MKAVLCALSLAVASAAVVAAPQNADKRAKQYEVARTLYVKFSQEALKKSPKAAFNEEAGRAFYMKKVPKGDQDFACASCHTDDPEKPGQHIETKKKIKPLAIHANPDSFTSVPKAEKAFAKHCREVYGADCEAVDKGNFLAYLLSL